MPKARCNSDFGLLETRRFLTVRSVHREHYEVWYAERINGKLVSAIRHHGCHVLLAKYSGCVCLAAAESDHLQWQKQAKWPSP